MQKSQPVSPAPAAVSPDERGDLYGNPAPPRYRIWSEYTPYAALHDPALLKELARRRIQLALAVTPELLSELIAVLRCCQAHAVAVALWPMLDDAKGRWASAGNADSYCDFVRRLLALCAEHAVLPQALAVDLEPPIERLRQVKDLSLHRPARPSARSAHAATAQLTALTTDAAALGLEIFAAAVPVVVVSPDAAARGWQRLLQTPIDALQLDRVSTMVYTSLLEGYSRGVVRREDARALLFILAQATQRRYGRRASISLGAVGKGALGDERTYRSPAELVEDVQLARAAGLSDLALFNLDGALARPPLAAWLDALVYTAPAPESPASTLRARLLWQGLRAAGYLGWLTGRT